MWSCEKIKKMMNVKKKENRRTEKFNFGKEKDWFASMNLFPDCTNTTSLGLVDR